ncbi:MAG: glycosyltransferase [Nocardioides sp.]|nr:glycosyltransferase [Nocardioides sp.]
MIASSRFPISEPFAGGLEAHTHALVSALRRRGHQVALFAAPGSDPRLGAELLDVPTLQLSDDARRDISNPPEWLMREHHAYLGLMLELARRDGTFDVVHNNSLHYLPVAMARSLSVPVVTTLHTPPLPWLESAVALSRDNCHFVAVSEAMRRSWAPVAPAHVIHNGVDPDIWTYGAGGPRAVWAGRLVPEKAPHEAVRAALLAGLSIDLVGPVGDRAYVDTQVLPLLGPRVRHLGHLSQAEVRLVVARAAVAVVSPAWPEPFGLVAAEAVMTGTPVAAYARGALPEIISPEIGRLAEPGDVVDLARAIRAAASLDREVVHAQAHRRFSLDTMVDAYEQVYVELARSRAA